MNAAETSTAAHYYEDVTATVGVTPLVPLRRIGSGLAATILVKTESRNPGGSVKDRIGLAMVLDAEQRGLLTPGKSVIVEPTSGNTGIALAMVGASRGYQVILTMPESMSIERRKLLAAYGAQLVLTPRELGMKGAVDEANRIAAANPNAWVAGQFDNPANPAVHFATTGPEIVQAVGESGLEIAAFVAGVGTGGTVTGVGRYLKSVVTGALAVAVEPAESPIIGQRRAGEDLTPGPHLIQGIGANFIPSVLDIDLLDEVIPIDADTAMVTARRLAAEEGLLVGISSGANVAAAIQLAGRPEFAGRAIVTVAPSTGERYLSTKLWEEVG